LQHCAYIPSCHHDIVPYPLLGPFPICFTYSRLVVGFLDKIIFCRMGLLAPCPTPILEDQGVSLNLDSTLWPYRHRWPCW
jgi:hypothetical protein